jgi:hypothetical protein
LQAPPKPKSAKLSANVKTLKFMQRRADRASADRNKRDQERALQEQRWVVDAKSATGDNASTLSSGLVVVRDVQGCAMGGRLSRRSFRGFNSVVERHHIAIKRETRALMAGQNAADIAIGDAEMAAVLGNRSKRGTKRSVGGRPKYTGTGKSS